MNQEMLNWVLGSLGALLGFMLKTLWQAVKDLQKADRELVIKIKDLETEVEKNAVTGEFVARSMDRIIAKLDRIEEKLSQKADRPHE